MRHRLLLVGERRPRLRAGGVIGLLFVSFSAGFLVASEVAFGTLFGLCSLAIAPYAGLTRGGLLVAQFAVFSSICWRAVFPPLIGYLRWGDAREEAIRNIPARYDTIRFTHVFLGPKGELEWGIEVALTEGVLTGFFVGGFVYGIGALYRLLRREDPSTHPYVKD